MARAGIIVATGATIVHLEAVSEIDNAVGVAEAGLTFLNLDSIRWQMVESCSSWSVYKLLTFVGDAEARAKNARTVDAKMNFMIVVVGAAGWCVEAE